MSTPEAPLSHRELWIERYTVRTNTLLSALALIYLATWSIQSIWFDPHATWYHVLGWFGVALWALFALDLLMRFVVTDHKRTFFRSNALDTLTVLVPPFRALRVLRIFTKGGILSRGKGKSIVSGGAVATALLATALVVWVGSLMVLNAERLSSNATITNIGDAVWWAFETITTVGYGDYTPVTGVGRAIAVLIMFVGISVLGVVSAGLAATLVKQTAPAPTPVDEVLSELAELKSMVASLQTQLNATSAATATAGPTS